MLDLKVVLANLDVVKEKTAARRTDVDFDAIETLAGRRIEAIQAYDSLRHEQRQASEQMKTIDKKSDAFHELRGKLKEMSNTLKSLSDERATVEAELEERLLYIPNLIADGVPIGASEDDNIVLETWGEPREFDFEPRDHHDIGEALGILDFARGAKVAGARFTALVGGGARLSRALQNFMLDMHTEKHGYREVFPPFLVNRDAMTGTGQLPKFEADAFQATGDLFLIPTAEVPVTNLHRDEILDDTDLPIHYAAYSSCFRLEAGSYGRDTRGLIRQHQFEKVELVKFCLPEHSEAEHESLVANACAILRALELPYRVVELCSADIGFSAARCLDIEVWLPGHGGYREISSCSNFRDFQARRAQIRFRRDGGKPEYVHTLNGSGLAIGRTLLAILENHQQADGTVLVPEVLRPYMGRDVITAV